MSYTIDLATHGRKLKHIYDSIVSSDPEISWAVFNYEAGPKSVLKPHSQGASGLEDFVEEFDDGKIQYGFVRVNFDHLPKFVLVGWVGEGVPERSKGYFNAHYSTVSKYFHGYHVQITARSSDDLSPAIIYKRVQDSSGSKYSGAKAVPLRPSYKSAQTGAAEEDWGDAPPVVEKELTVNRLESAYRPTKVDLSGGSSKPTTSTVSSSSSDRPEPVKGSYQPVGKVDIAALRAQAKNSPFTDDRPAPLQSSYKPVGKVDIAAIRAQASKKSSPPEPEHKGYNREMPEEHNEHKLDTREESSGVETSESNLSVKERVRNFGGARPAVGSIAAGTNDDDTPKSFQDRLSVFSSSGRLSELPKPKVSNKVSERFSSAGGRGTAPTLPKNMFGDESRAQTGLRDFAAQGGKTPAQLWAERHAKNTNITVPSEPHREHEPEPERADIGSLRNKFSGATLNEPEPVDEQEPEVEQDKTGSFADLTSKFAASRTPPEPVNREPTPEPMREPTPEPIPEPAPEPAHRDLVPEPVPSALPAREAIASAFASGVPNPLTPEQHEPVPAATEEPRTAVAAYDYDKDDDNEISLREGEVITDIEFVDTEWWQGKNSSGEVGLFPSNYVELEDAGQALPSRPEEPEAPKLPSRPEEIRNGNSRPSAVAEFDYEAAEEGELTFPEGAVITEIDFVDESWWSGVYNGERALFPANYVTLQ